MKTHRSITLLLWITTFLFCIQENVNSLLLQPPRTRSNDSNNLIKNEQQQVPFIVQKLKIRPDKSDCDEISSLVISVFFQEEAERLPKNRKGGSITKPFILAYLKNLQYGDVRGKRFMLPTGINNSMFVARRVIPATQSGDDDDDDNTNGLSIQDLLKPSNEEENGGGAVGGLLYNKDILPPSECGYTTEGVLGFVDVTEKNFGLSTDENSNVPTGRQTWGTNLRPVLTNLSVQPEARNSGVGSALVDACEAVVVDEWTNKYFEMVLEVEEENEGAQKFYERRGYKALFSDPTSRRYDTNGLLLSNVRTTKICYQKNLTEKGARRKVDGENAMSLPGMFFANIRKAIGLE